MLKDEMQQFLDREALRGTDELEAWRALAQIIGITFPENKLKQSEENKAE